MTTPTIGRPNPDEALRERLRARGVMTLEDARLIVQAQEMKEKKRQ